MLRIHHIDDYRVVDGLQEDFPEITAAPKTTRPHLLYDLGPIIGPANPVPNGAQYRSGRNWVALDLLFTSNTVKDALEGTRERRDRKAEEPQ